MKAFIGCGNSAALGRVAELRLGGFNAQELANRSPGRGRLRRQVAASQHHVSLFAASLRASEWRVEDINPQIHGLSACDGWRLNAPLSAVLARTSEQRVGHPNAQNFANTVRAFEAASEPSGQELANTA